MSFLSVEHISTGYGKKQVLFDITFNINKGECVLLIGSNGSGKSTLFKAIYRGLNLWDEKGKIVYNKEDISELEPYQLIKKGIVYIPQKDELFEDLTVYENLELSLIHLNDKKENKERINALLVQIPIFKNKLKQEVNELSGGERKLLSLAMAFLNKPKVLLYDEPLAGLSGENIKLIISYLKSFKKVGTTLILIEHRVKELLPISDKIIGLKLGYKNKYDLNTIEDIKKYLL